MTIRIHEVHPTLVHFPIALMPIALAADALGWLLRKPALKRLGKQLMPLTAAGAALSGATGLIAQQAVRAEGRAHDLLVTHRNLNLGVLGVISVLAAVRSRRAEPGPGYLLAGLAVVAAMSYTAYLGGKMVYDYGVGVSAANGVLDAESPEVRRDSLSEVAKTSAGHARRGLHHTVEHARKGEIAPALGRHP